MEENVCERGRGRNKKENNDVFDTNFVVDKIYFLFQNHSHSSGENSYSMHQLYLKRNVTLNMREWNDSDFDRKCRR
jgi:hypothetical protein